MFETTANLTNVTFTLDRAAATTDHEVAIRQMARHLGIFYGFRVRDNPNADRWERDLTISLRATPDDARVFISIVFSAYPRIVKGYVIAAGGRAR